MSWKIIILVFTFLLSVSGIAAQKLTVDEIVKKHIEAIGKSDEIAKINNQTAFGNVSFTILRAGGVGGDGKIVISSEARKFLLGMSFQIPNYRLETIVFDGKDYKISYVMNNARSQLGNYIFRYSEILKEGLLGGVLSTGWALRRLSETGAKIRLDGTKKIKSETGDSETERDAYVINYIPRSGSDTEVRIFIDKENFQHLRTEYRRIISALQGPTPDASASRRERREILIEDFSNFKRVNNLNLPQRYKIYLMIEGQSQTLEYEWKAVFSNFYFNQQLDPDSFKVK